MRSANLFFFTQPQEMFETWHQAQQNTPFEEKEEQFFVEFQQQPVNYGSVIDTSYADSLYWKEQHLYGSSRLGIAKPELEVTNYTPSNFSLLTSNFKNYELTNHLGNVLATIKDEKQQIDQNADGIVDYYEPIVITANDYYPFGMVMPNRSFSLAGSNYRFGFNGKEDDREIEGQQDYGFRIFDSRLGRFKSVDPLTKKYPELTPYQFASNTPIQAIDLDGLEAFFVHGTINAAKIGGYNISLGYHKFSSNQAIVKDIPKLFNNNPATTNTSFSWTGDNSNSARSLGGQQLADYICNATDITNLKETITIVGHSHGGNVAIEAAKILIEKGLAPEMLNIVLLNTPGRVENVLPANSPVNVYSVNAISDEVQALGSNNGKIFPKNVDKEIIYEDQNSSFPCNFSNHCPSDANTKVIMPQLEKAKQEHETTLEDTY